MVLKTYDDPSGSGGMLDFYDGNIGFLEPYLEDDDSDVYKCPATSYDPNSWYYGNASGRSYTGFLDFNNRWPRKINKYFVKYGNNAYYTSSGRTPFIIDSIYGPDETDIIGSSVIHGNTGELNLGMTDGSVIPLKINPAQWYRTSQLNAIMLNAFESILGEFENGGNHRSY